MTKPHIAVVYLPGNNCEEESARIIQANGMNATIVRWNQREGIEKYDGYFIVGGWAYEDRIRAGVIASKDPIIKKIKKESESKPVIGICNGCQVLAESGMIPGFEDSPEMALAPNINPLVSGYYNAWVHIKQIANAEKSVFTMHNEADEVFKVPVAHGEGRFVTADQDLIRKLEKNDQIVFKYCSGDGDIMPDFPINPNGTTENIAGICNKNGTVLGMMPHPERASFVYQSQDTEEKLHGQANKVKMNQFTNANKIFTSLKAYFDEGQRLN